ncbi:MAG: carboxylating nicotinate-nucleotide diphosphorylase [Myxococcales bacterium]|nr:carboxylating nicotinate-nucleotide diphosphorylase [Myxococcales bacterium]
MPARARWVGLVEAALVEDLGSGDLTSEATIPAGASGEARVEAREALVLAGLEVASEVFAQLDVEYEAQCADGDQLEAGALLAHVRGPARGILAGERTALNFLQRLSGIATGTARFVAAVAGTRARIFDTRKTTPGWRLLEKYAVRCGGGFNHRLGLYDGILIKDNHLRVTGDLGAAVKSARAAARGALAVQVEVESWDEARDAIAAGADLLLIDNQTPEALAEIARRVAGRVPVEATGGIRLDSVAQVARTGVDRISIGALTHSAAAVDIALEWNAPSST